MQSTDDGEPRRRSSSGRGGYREGSGRKPGSASRMAVESRRKAQETGLLPHEILLSMARGEPQREVMVDPNTGMVLRHPDTGEELVRYVNLDVEQRRDAAKAAAPYYAPKISTVEVIAGVTSDNLDELIKVAAAEAGFDLAALGEGQEGEGEEGAERAPKARRRVD